MNSFHKSTTLFGIFCLLSLLSLIVVEWKTVEASSEDVSRDKNSDTKVPVITSEEEAAYQKYMKENAEVAKDILATKEDVPKKGRSLGLKTENKKPKPQSKPSTYRFVCETCGELKALNILLDEERNPTLIDNKLECKNVASGLSRNSDGVTLSCAEGQRTIGIAFRFGFKEDEKSNATDEMNISNRFVQNVSLVCAKDILDCQPILGTTELWGPNKTSKPQNASLCVPGDALTGVEYTVKNDLIIDIRSICCTKALHPRCKFNFTQTLNKLVVAGEDFCTYCDRQKPVREELLQEHEDAVWYTQRYKDALHYSFLRQLVRKPGKDIPLYNATLEEFKKVKIDHECSFGGTTLKPNTYFEFFLSAEERCGLPVYQRTFLALEHGIRFHTRTARLLTPGLKLYETPKTLGWMKAAGECYLDCEVKKDEL